ncbi:MAG: HAMP domain-containing sensor histidine kinase [Pirellulaceae bacterium]
MTTVNQNRQTPDSEIQELRQQVEQLKQRLFEAQKLTAMGELVGTTTHEFNNVLMSMINFARMGLRHQDQKTRDNCFEKIAAAGDRAAKLTTGILAMAKNRGNRLEPTDIAQIVADTVTLMERELRKYRIQLDVVCDETPQAMANGNQLQQVLLNLIINARQAMPQGGTLLLKVAHNPADRMVEIMVRDSGVGIPADQLPRIFESFYSTKSGPDETGTGGTGLGLAACRDIIEAHRGKIRVQSTPGVGTAFTLRIPEVTPAANIPAPTKIPTKIPTATPAAGRV